MGTEYNHALAIWTFIKANKITGVSDKMLKDKFGKTKVAVLLIMEYYGFLCYLDKGRLYPFQVAEKAHPQKSIEYYFTRYLMDYEK